MDVSERLLVEEISRAGAQALQVARGLAPGALIRMIRKQIGMPQAVLAQKAKVPQSTISRIEKGLGNSSVETLSNILQALECDLVILPVLRAPVRMIRQKQARKKAKAQLDYLRGTMHLEGQEPDAKFMDALMEQEETKLLKGTNVALWKGE